MSGRTTKRPAARSRKRKACVPPPWVKNNRKVTEIRPGAFSEQPMPGTGEAAVYVARDNVVMMRSAPQLVPRVVIANPTDPDERWHSFPPSLKQRVLALVDELANRS